jgi:hypothetical protein
MLLGMGYPMGKKTRAGVGMGKNLYPHAGMSFLTGRIRVSRCGYGMVLPTGFCPLPSLPPPHHKVAQVVSPARPLAVVWRPPCSPSQPSVMRRRPPQPLLPLSLLPYFGLPPLRLLSSRLSRVRQRHLVPMAWCVLLHLTEPSPHHAELAAVPAIGGEPRCWEFGGVWRCSVAAACLPPWSSFATVGRGPSPRHAGCRGRLLAEGRSPPPAGGRCQRTWARGLLPAAAFRARVSCAAPPPAMPIEVAGQARLGRHHPSGAGGSAWSSLGYRLLRAPSPASQPLFTPCHRPRRPTRSRSGVSWRASPLPLTFAIFAPRSLVGPL